MPHPGARRAVALAVGLLVLLSGAVRSYTAVEQPHPGPAAPALHTILEMEQTAYLLALLLQAGRSVINENQDVIDNPTGRDSSFTPELFERQLREMFRIRSGMELDDLAAARIPPSARRLLVVLSAVSREVVAGAQAEIKREGVAYKGFIPAVFGARVVNRFADLTGIRLKQTSLAPRNDANRPDAFETAALQAFADPSYPREGVIGEVTATSGLRLMFPLYATRRCLDCHGEPRGLLDRTGHPREGLHLGQNAGAISIVMPLEIH